MADDTIPTQIPHMILMVSQDLPDEIELYASAELKSPGLNLMILRRQSGPFAGVELYLPTAVALFIAAGFFNGFLQKAGEESYTAIKSAAQALWRRTRGLDLVTVGTPGKALATRSYSLAYSITGEVVPGLSFKFLIRTEIDGEEARAGISAFFELIDDLCNDRLKESDCRALLTYKPVGGTVLVTYDAKQRKIVPVNAFEDRE